MSMKAQAKICYGIYFNEEECWDHESNTHWSDVDWQSYFAEKIGIEPPEHEWKNVNDQEWDVFNKRAKEVWNELGIELVESGCNDDNGVIHITFAIKDSILITSWEKPLELRPFPQYVTHQWKEKLKRFCNAVNIPCKEPRWYLLAYYD
jgi:hypothetical protein